MSWKTKRSPFSLTPNTSWKIKTSPVAIIPSVKKPRYNEGNLISSRDDATIDLDGKTGQPITVNHIPCGYWWNDL